MTRSIRSSIIIPAMLIVLAACHDASAQYRGVRRQRRPSFSDQPSISPYINLVNPNLYVGQSYVGIVSPLIEQQEASSRNTVAIRSLQRSFDADAATTTSSPYGARRIGVTGHHTTYMNFSHYYGGGGGAGGGGRGSSFTRRSGSAGAGGIGAMGMGSMGMGGFGFY